MWCFEYFFHFCPIMIIKSPQNNPLLYQFVWVYCCSLVWLIFNLCSTNQCWSHCLCSALACSDHWPLLLTNLCRLCLCHMRLCVLCLFVFSDQSVSTKQCLCSILAQIIGFFFWPICVVCVCVICVCVCVFCVCLCLLTNLCPPINVSALLAPIIGFFFWPSQHVIRFGQIKPYNIPIFVSTIIISSTIPTSGWRNYGMILKYTKN